MSVREIPESPQKPEERSPAVQMPSTDDQTLRKPFPKSMPDNLLQEEESALSKSAGESHQKSNQKRSLASNRSTIIQLAQESPTKRRVRDFNAQYLQLSKRDSSALSSVGLVQKKQVIRSSTGWSSREEEEEDVRGYGRSQQMETQFGIGEETQGILGAVDLACEPTVASAQPAALAQPEDPFLTKKPRNPSRTIIEEGQNTNIEPAPESRASKEAGLRQSVDQTEINAARRTSGLVMEAQIKEQRVPSSQNEEMETTNSLASREATLEETSMDEERVPPSQHENRKTLYPLTSKAAQGESRRKSPCWIKKEQAIGCSQQAAFLDDAQTEDDRVTSSLNDDIAIESSQQRRISSEQRDEDGEHGGRRVDFDNDLPMYYGETQLPHPSVNPCSPSSLAPDFKPGPTNEEEGQDPASEQLLRETTQAFATRVPSTPIPAPPPTSHRTSADSYHDQVRPSQATTVDETQASSALRTQRTLYDSPMPAAQTVLVSSSPVPAPPASSSLSSSKDSYPQTPKRLRFGGMTPVTFSQLIPESLRDDDVPMPPGWTQDEDEDEDDDEL